MSRRLFALVTGLALVAAFLVTAGTSLRASASSSNTLDLKVLLIGGAPATPVDPTTAAWEATLTSEGVPYTEVDAVGTVSPYTVTLPTLSSGTTGYYNGVVIADDPAGFAAGQLTALYAYESAFGVRQLDGYEFPTASLGETDVTGESMSGITGTLTAAGLAAFPELEGQVPFDPTSYGYPATADVGAPFTPVIEESGDILGGVYAHPSTDAQAGVSELVLNFNYNANSVQWLVMGPSLIAWVTQDTYLGLYRNYIEMDIDDVFTPDDVWCTAVGDPTNCTSADTIDYSDADAVRMTPTDVTYAAAWEAANNFRFDMLYNGGGSVDYAAAHSGTDPLLAAFQATDGSTGQPYADDFGWLSHTYDTPYLDVGCATQNYIEAEVNENTSWAATATGTKTGASGSGLGLFQSTNTSDALGYENPDVFVPGNHSGFADLVPGNPATVDPPDLDGTTFDAGGTLAAGEYAYAVTDQFVASTGTPTTSNPQSQAAVTDVNVTSGESVQLNWEAICHAAQYNIYRASAPGGAISGSWAYLGSVSTPFSATLPDNSSGTAGSSTTVVADGAGELEQDYIDTGAAGTPVVDGIADPTAEDALETPWEQNPYFTPALNALGITAVGDDASKPYPYPADDQFGIGTPYTCTSTNCYAAGQTFLDGTTAQVVPRHPNDIYYDAATEDQEQSEFDYLETGTAPYDTYTFAQIVSYEDSSLLSEMLSNDPRPNYVHQTNIVGNPGDGAAASDGTLYSVLNPLLTDYHSYISSTAPYQQLTLGAIGTTLAEQTAWSGTTTPAAATGSIATVTGSETNGVITLDNTGAGAANVPLTAPAGTVVDVTGSPAFGQAYGGTLSAWVPLAAGATESLTTPAPGITSAATATTSEGAAFTFPVTTTGTPTPSLSEIGALPTGITFVDNGNGTGTLSGIAAAGTANVYPITLTATNAVGATRQSFILTVDTAGGGGGGGGTPTPTPTPPSGSGGSYTPLTPLRLLDTRATKQTLGPNSALSLGVVSTADGVPSTATAVALNVTVTNTTGASYLSVFPTGEAQPVVSNLNWTKGETVANSVIAPIGTGNSDTFYNKAGSADVVVDLEGYFAPASDNAGAYVPLTPARITDTRTGSGQPNAGGTLDTGAALNVQVTGEHGIPAGATGAILNVTVTDTGGAGYLTVYPQGATRPTASNLNWNAGETVANRVLAPLSSSGMITLYNSHGSTDVVVDVDGYFTSNTATLPTGASLFTPITPIRVVDTRATHGTLGTGSTFSTQIAGSDGIISTANAAVLNVTATNTASAGFFTVFPGGTVPTASDLNWSAGQTVPNMAVATLSSTGTLSVYNHSGSADLIIDAFGYFSPVPTS